MEETVVPPLQIPRPYSSSNHRISRLRLSTPQLSSPITSMPRLQPSHQSSPCQSSAIPHKAYISPSMPVFSMPQSAPWTSDSNHEESIQSSYHQNAGPSTLRENRRHQSPHASAHAASQTPPRETLMDSSSSHFSSILSNLAGSLNSLREKLAETRISFLTINHSPGFWTTAGLSRHSPYKALPKPRHKNRSRTDMMVSNDVVLDLTHAYTTVRKPCVMLSRPNYLSPKIKTSNKRLKMGITMASPEEVDHFDRGEIPAPTFIPSCPYWDDVRCLWNRSLADQFINELVAAGHNFDGEARDGLKDHFLQQLSRKNLNTKHQGPTRLRHKPNSEQMTNIRSLWQRIVSRNTKRQ